MHSQEHLALLVSDEVMLDVRRQDQEAAAVQVVRLAFGHNPQVTFEHVNRNDAAGAVRRQARQVTEEKERNRRRAVLVQGLLTVPGLAGPQLVPSCCNRGVKVELMLRSGEPLLGMLAQPV